MLDAQQNLFAAAPALAERQQLVAAVQLYRALGGGWPVACDRLEGNGMGR